MFTTGGCTNWKQQQKAHRSRLWYCFVVSVLSANEHEACTGSGGYFSAEYCCYSANASASASVVFELEEKEDDERTCCYEVTVTEKMRTHDVATMCSCLAHRIDSYSTLTRNTCLEYFGFVKRTNSI